MLTKLERDFLQMHAALRRIMRYQTTARLRINSQKDWGLDYTEAVEMAYENIQDEAKGGLKGVRLSKGMHE